MSRPLKAIFTALEDVNREFSDLQQASGDAVDTRSIEQGQQEIRELERELRNAQPEAQQLGDDLQDSMERGAQGTMNMIGKLGLLAGALKGLRRAQRWFSDSLGFADMQNQAEMTLISVISNRGMDRSAFDSIAEEAMRQQQTTMFGNTTMIAGAAELARHFRDDEAVTAMMGTLANYAAGMSGGAAVNQQQMRDYASELGRVLVGDYNVLRRKGFELTEQQKEIISYGSDMERALLLDDIVSQSWAGLAEQMANTPLGQMEQFRNHMSDIRQEVGNRLYPAIMLVVQTMNRNIPLISRVLGGIVTVISRIIMVASYMINFLAHGAQWVADNWHIIKWVLLGVLGLLAAVKLAMLAVAAKKALLTLKQAIYNAVVMMNPKVLIAAAIIAAIMAVIAVIIWWIARTRQLEDESSSALGNIMAAVFQVGAGIWNFIAGWINGMIQMIWQKFVIPIAEVINWVYNAFTGGFDSIGDAFLNLLGSMTSWLIGWARPIAGLIDSIFGTDINGWIAGHQDTLRNLGRGENYRELISVEAPQLGRIDYADAAARGYAFGSRMEALGDGFRFDDLEGMMGYMGEIADHTAETAKNTAATSEDLRWMIDLAEKEVVNRFTAATVNVDMSGMTNTMNNGVDADGVVRQIVEEFTEAMDSSGEGEHF